MFFLFVFCFCFFFLEFVFFITVLKLVFPLWLALSFQFGGLIHLGRDCKLCILYESLKMLVAQRGPKISFLSTDGGSRSKGEHFPYEQEIKFFAKVQYMTRLVSASVFTERTHQIITPFWHTLTICKCCSHYQCILSDCKKYLHDSCKRGQPVVPLVSSVLPTALPTTFCSSCDLVMSAPSPRQIHALLCDIEVVTWFLNILYIFLLAKWCVNECMASTYILCCGISVLLLHS